MRLGKDDFLGTWRLNRQISDRYAGHAGRFRGLAQFSLLESDGLTYDETGSMQLGDGPQMTATRRYLWLFDTDGVAVHFSDGKAFYRFTPSGMGQGTDHPCGDDYYKVQYDFTRWPDWTATWTVTGPRKDYTSVSRYAKEL